MGISRQQVLKKLELAGLSESDFERLGAQYWIDYIIKYRETGRCGSVNWSTVNFIPVLSKLLDAIPSSHFSKIKWILILSRDGNETLHRFEAQTPEEAIAKSAVLAKKEWEERQEQFPFTPEPPPGAILFYEFRVLQMQK
ncbi:MAG: hypothetical protein Q8P23_00275 [bacterium]|nr:hypothetical protein [bacterium]